VGRRTRSGVCARPWPSLATWTVHLCVIVWAGRRRASRRVLARRRLPGRRCRSSAEIEATCAHLRTVAEISAIIVNDAVTHRKLAAFGNAGLIWRRGHSGGIKGITMATKEIDVSETAARERADQIKNGLDSIAEHIEQIPLLVIAAYQAGDWKTLGYKSWDGYVAEEFQTHLLKLDRAVRKNWTRRLSSAGLNQRQISAITNVSEMTTSRDARDTGGGTKGTDDPEDDTKKAVTKLRKDIERVRDDLRKRTGPIDRYLMVDLHHAMNMLAEITGDDRDSALSHIGGESNRADSRYPAAGRASTLRTRRLSDMNTAGTAILTTPSEMSSVGIRTR